ncbi:hypothetical protein DC74_167 [Streptomyces noursei]|nr:hypothetical protein DC74_167 [Streptomyces noursei]
MAAVWSAAPACGSAWVCRRLVPPEGAYPLAPVPAFAVVQFLERTVGLPGLSRRTVLLTDSPVGSAVSLGPTQGVRGLWVSVSTVGPLTGVLDGLASGAAW